MDLDLRCQAHRYQSLQTMVEVDVVQHHQFRLVQVGEACCA